MAANVRTSGGDGQMCDDGRVNGTNSDLRGVLAKLQQQGGERAESTASYVMLPVFSVLYLFKVMIVNKH